MNEPKKPQLSEHIRQRTQEWLRKVSGSYIFIHRLLIEHFASLTEEDIKRLSGLR